MVPASEAHEGTQCMTPLLNDRGQNTRAQQKDKTIVQGGRQKRDILDMVPVRLCSDSVD